MSKTFLCVDIFMALEITLIPICLATVDLNLLDVLSINLDPIVKSAFLSNIGLIISYTQLTSCCPSPSNCTAIS